MYKPYCVLCEYKNLYKMIKKGSAKFQSMGVLQIQMVAVTLRRDKSE